MTTWILLTSNYILILLLALYVTAAYTTMWARRWEAGLVHCMGICRYLLHGVGFFVLYLASGEFRILPFYLIQLAILLLADILQKKIYDRGIPVLYQNMMLLLSVGFLIITRLNFDSAVKQFIMAVAAFGICSFLPWLLKHFPKLFNLGWLYTFVGLGLLLAVLILGNEVFGAKNWLTIHNITFQPSEFVKLTFILSMAALLTKNNAEKYRNLLLVSVVAASHVGLLVLANDFGGALIFFVIYLFMLFVLSADLLFPLTAVLLGSLAAILAYQYSGHIRDRVMAWQTPFSCIEKEGYQVAQALFAIGNGEWFGTGLLSGMPKTIPIVKSDFIFAAIAEEFGAVFAALLLCVYINCIIYMMALALERRQPFFFGVTTGAAALFGIQLILNVGGVIKMIPSTGVTLSFISYGGSSLFCSVFLFQGIQAMRSGDSKEKDKRKEKYTGQKMRMIVVCAAILLMLCMMVAYFLTITVKTARDNFYNEYNQRIAVKEKTMLKGQIRTMDGTILARSILGEDQNVYRLYPHGMTAAFITGRMDAGRSGLEAQYMRELYEVDLPFFECLKRKAEGILPEGNCLVTTISADLQKAAYEALEGYNGAIGVLEVKTGRILAMASAPSYDPNSILVQWEELSKRTDAPFLNRLTRGLYPPGSTFKIVTTLAYLRSHAAGDFSYTCEGSAEIRNTTVHCYHEKAHGAQTLKEAFANSCNTAFAAMGEQISIADYMTTAESLGFGTGFPNTVSYLPGSFVLTEETESFNRVYSSFGQGEIVISPFHNLLIAAAIANGGRLQLPYLVERLTDCDDREIEAFQSAGSLELMSTEHAKLLTEYMISASESKMKEFADRGVTVAGKTGSAETATGTHSWYLCFAPADNPQIAIAVLMENAGNGSSHALPAAKKILEEWLENSD